MNKHPAQTDGRLRQLQLKMVLMLKEVDKVCQTLNIDYWLEGGTLLGAIRHQGFIPWDDDLDISMPRQSFETFLKKAPELLPDSLFLQTKETDPGYFNFVVPLKIRDKNSLFLEWHENGDEPYHHGIFIDVFVYDSLHANAYLAKYHLFLAKKILRLMRGKNTSLKMGHHTKFYELLGTFFNKNQLKNALESLIRKSQSFDSPWLSYGYDSVNKNRVHVDDIYPLTRTEFEGEQFSIIKNYEIILKQLYGDYKQMPPEEERVMMHCKELIPHL